MADNTRVDVVAHRAASRRLIAFGVVLYLALCAVMFLRIRHANDHQFFFALDDPYIHLALAKGIAHGHFGINPGEPSSPSSSILWPLLLTPFAASSNGPLWALVLNLLAGVCAAALFGYTVSGWPERDAKRSEGIRRVIAVGFLVFIGNLVGLTFLGMEHTLQVFLAGVVALGIIRCLQHRNVSPWILLAAFLGPAVRYESLGLTLALCIALWGRNQRRTASLLFLASIVPLIVFAAFLRHLGLPALPTSVLVKGGVHSAGVGTFTHFAFLLGSSFKQILVPERSVLLLLVLTLVGLAWTETDRARKFAIAGAATAGLLHLIIGQFGWFHRYEVYVVLFSTLVLLYLMHERDRMLLGWFALGLLAIAGPYIEAWRTTIAGTHDTFLLQQQMHRFADEYYTGNVAVNDLGLVSYGRRPDQYVLDLVGLGSAEAARQKDKNPAWLDSITTEHHVGAVMIFRSWFPKVPADWTRVGAICLVHQPVMLPDNCVQFYATPLEASDDLSRKFKAFARSLPDGVIPVSGDQADAAALANR